MCLTGGFALAMLVAPAVIAPALSQPSLPFALTPAQRRDLGLAVEIDSSPGNPYGLPRLAHAVLTHDLVDRPGHSTRAALDRVLAFLRERLQPLTPA
jgi:hypothetical protein